MATENTLIAKEEIDIDDGYVPNGYDTPMPPTAYEHPRYPGMLSSLEPLPFKPPLLQQPTYTPAIKLEACDNEPAAINNVNNVCPLESMIKHVCAKCGMEYARADMLQQHMDNVHIELRAEKKLKMQIISNTEAKCQICGLQVQHETLADLQAHHFEHLLHKPFKCRCHNYHFQTFDMAMAHLRLHSASKKVKPTILKLDSPPSVGMHFMERGKSPTNNSAAKTQDGSEYPHNYVRYVCPECGLDLPSDERWKEHCNTAHDFKSMSGLNMTKIDGIQVQCNACNAVFSSRSDNYKLRRHRLTHSPYKAFHCKLCNYTRKRKEDVLLHIRQSHLVMHIFPSTKIM